MTDRPIAAILAAVAAVMFVAAFSAGAVLRPETATVARDGAGPSSSAASTQETAPATLAAPSLSRVVALPALHLPVHKPKHARRKARTVTVRRTPAPPAATPVPQPAPAYSPPPQRTRNAQPQPTPAFSPPPQSTRNARPQRKTSVGKTFDTSG